MAALTAFHLGLRHTLGRDEHSISTTLLNDVTASKNMNVLNYEHKLISNYCYTTILGKDHTLDMHFAETMLKFQHSNCINSCFPPLSINLAPSPQGCIVSVKRKPRHPSPAGMSAAHVPY